MQTDNYNRGGYYAFLFCMVFSLSFFVYVVVVHPGINLKEVPVAKEIPAAGTPANGGASEPVDIDISKVAKPWVENVQVAEHGHHVFQTNCQICHGEKGLGNGPAGLNLNPPPRNFVEGKWKNGGDSITLFKTLQVGIQGSSMASFAHLPAADRWSVIQFIRSITHNKIKDDPAKLEAFAQTAK